MKRSEVRRQIMNCQRCELHLECQGPVPFRGPSPALWAVVGEAPGQVEDDQGKPFVGPSGRLVGEFLAKVGLDMTEAFVCNTVSCFPHGTPKERHIEACAQNLHDQLVLARAPYVLVLGRVALSAFDAEASIMRDHGKTWSVGNGSTDVTMLATFHPAAVLRNRALTRAWRLDLEAFAEMVNHG